MSVRINISVTADDTGVYIHAERLRPNGSSMLSKKLLAAELQHNQYSFSTIGRHVGTMIEELLANE